MLASAAEGDERGAVELVGAGWRRLGLLPGSRCFVGLLQVGREPGLQSIKHVTSNCMDVNRCVRMPADQMEASEGGRLLCTHTASYKVNFGDVPGQAGNRAAAQTCSTLHWARRTGLVASA